MNSVALKRLHNQPGIENHSEKYNFGIKNNGTWMGESRTVPMEASESLENSFSQMNLSEIANRHKLFNKQNSKFKFYVPQVALITNEYHGADPRFRV